MVVEIPYQAAKDGTFPKIFAHENKHGAPDVSLFVTSGLMQLSMIFVYLANNAWNTMLSITAVMILPPYLASTAYLWQLAGKNDFPKGAMVHRCFAVLCGVAGTVYALWMIYAAGLSYLSMAFWFMALGILVYVKARRENISKDPSGGKTHIFTPAELLGAVLIVAIALAALVWQINNSPVEKKALHKWAQEVTEKVETL
jgi:arginine:ornithine antiporter/lysine permease